MKFKIRKTPHPCRSLKRSPHLLGVLGSGFAQLAFFKLQEQGNLVRSEQTMAAFDLLSDTMAFSHYPNVPSL